MKMNMKYSCIQLMDLPDEIILIILKKLHNVEVLYSLIDINKRLNTIVNDSIFTSNLTLRTLSSKCLSYQFTKTILDRFCHEILPKIHAKIQWLDLESASMKRILLLTDYPNLYGLGLYDLTSETAKDLFTDESILNRICKNQIFSLVIDIYTCKVPNSMNDINTYIYTKIFTMFNNLQYLDFGRSGSTYNRLSFDISPPIVFSSTLLELHVVIESYTDCLYLLDGRFDQLHTFYVIIDRCAFPTTVSINKQKELPNLKCFVLTHTSAMLIYDEFLVPLLHRMSNLEKLSLYFAAYRNKGLIDGNTLENNIINHMTTLKEFTFNICSIISLCQQINSPSNEDIQYTFRNFKAGQIISCINYFPEIHKCYCHYYSYPYTLTYYKDITNNFPGGIFKNVREVSLFDERPFEHEFFLQIQKSFPFMKKLTLNNRKAQKNDNQQWPIIEYPHHIALDIGLVHECYVEQFLVNTKMSLPNNIFLLVNYRSLEMVTHYFTRDATRSNCSKINDLAIMNKPRYSQHLNNYFPRAVLR